MIKEVTEVKSWKEWKTLWEATNDKGALLGLLDELQGILPAKSGFFHTEAYVDITLFLLDVAKWMDSLDSCDLEDSRRILAVKAYEIITGVVLGYLIELRELLDKGTLYEGEDEIGTAIGHLLEFFGQPSLYY